VAHTTGVNFQNARAFIQDRFPGEGMGRVLAQLEPVDRALLGDDVRAKDWYDLGAYVRVIRAIDTVLGAGDLRLLPVLGRYEAERDRGFVQGLFLRMASPAWAVKLVAEYWSHFHDSGSWTVRREGDHLLHGVLEGVGVVDEAMCAELVGYIPRVMEFAGGRDVTMTHPLCRARGAEACHFEMSWQG